MARKKKENADKPNGNRGTYVRCAAEGCRRKVTVGELCAACAAKAQTVEGAVVVAEECVHRMMASEAEHWGRLFAEFQGHNQAAQLLAMQQREVQRDAAQRIADLEQRRQAEIARAAEVRRTYEQVTQELCTKYKTDRQYTVIDVDSRAIREERPAT